MREHGLARARGAGDQDGNVERRDQRGLLEHVGHGRGVADDVRAREALADLAGVIADPGGAVAGQQAIGERRELAREQLDAGAILGRERAEHVTTLEVHHADRRMTHGRAQDGADLVLLDAATIAKMSSSTAHGVSMV